MLATSPPEEGALLPTPVPILEMRSIDKRFPGVHALMGVSMDVLPGEVHALVGENGAGKSTLMKILAGVYVADGGEIVYKGQPYAPRTPRESRDAGIVTIYQELNLVPDLSVTENMYLGVELQRGPFLDWPAMHRRARQLLSERLHLDLDPRTSVGRLGVGQQQMVEVAKALLHEADIIIMDEPTAALSLREIADLFAIVRELKSHGVSTIFISHHLDETFELSDRTSVLRDGQHVATVATADLTKAELIKYMVGRDLASLDPKRPAPIGAEVLRVEGLTRHGVFENISFSARAGEIVGIAGLVGAGRTEVVRGIFGADPLDAGRIFIDGREVSIKSPRDAIDNGIALLTEDRKSQGLVLIFDVRENITLSILDRLSRGQLTDKARERQVAAGFIDRLAIKASSQEQLALNLSGGTQQKVVLSKWLAAEARVIIFDEPTRGIDVGAKAEIYQIMNELVAQGDTIIMVSSELPEILAMSDRVLVMQGGRLRGELSRDEASQERIMHLATVSDGENGAEPAGAAA
ncbi:MAG TPA: sugar ABC transporter ATP-binding protein [Anaerolineae bacterium]|jgi:ribose transport system ATP-binding protein|nr:sugar ABC transporter ATP-binding protein [Anaerolineae bacterium]